MNILLGPLVQNSPVSQSDARRAVWFLIGLTMVVKIALALVLPLGVDEAYAIAVAREYSLSFFDHPPISFWLPVAFADVTGIEHRLVYRAPFLLAGAGTAYVIYEIGRAVSGARAGLWTLLLFCASPFFLLSGGVFVVPDGPLNLASALAVLALMRIASCDGRVPLRLWVWAGLALALALGSKYQAAWIPLAVLIYMVATPQARRWFYQPGPWIGGLIGLVGLLPVVLWNLDNDWASFAFHGGRAGGGTGLVNFALMFAAQALFLLPVVLLAAVAGLWAGLRNWQEGPRFLLVLIAIGPVAIFNVIYLTSSAPFAHWTMPGWLFALPLAGVWLAEKGEAVRRRFLIWTKALLVLLWVPLLLLALHANTGALTKYVFEETPKWDNTHALFDYGGLEAALNARGLLDETDVLMTTGWIDAAHIDTALKGRKPMQVFKGIRAHHFTYLSDAEVRGRGLLMAISPLRKAEKTGQRLLDKARDLDPNARLLPPVILQRGGQDYVAVSLVRLVNEGH